MRASKRKKYVLILAISVVLIALLALFYPQVSYASKVKIASINIRVITKKDSLNPWNKRRLVLRDFVREQRLDIVCFQEMLPRQCKYLRGTLRGYSVVDNKNTGLSGDYNYIFYKTNKYQCVESGKFWLSEHPDSIGLAGWDAMYPRTVIWAKFREKSNGRCFFVFNTHLDHKGKQSKPNSMRLIKSQMLKIGKEYPMILAGDFNSSVNSETFSIVQAAEFTLHDAYSIAKERLGVTYSFHGFGNRVPAERRKRYDFICVTDGVTVEYINIPKEKRVNGVFMSDHCPVVADLSF